MAPVQQLAEPPGSVPQLGPPHFPHSFGQQALPLRMPLAQLGSAASARSARSATSSAVAVGRAMSPHQHRDRPAADGLMLTIERRPSPASPAEKERREHGFSLVALPDFF